MALIYDDNAPREPYRGRPVHEMNGTSNYLRHYRNLLYLKFIANNERATRAERNQAAHELTICERKLEFWKRHPKYDHQEALRGVEQLKKEWQA